MTGNLNTRGRPILPSIAIKFEYDGKRYTANVMRHPDGRPAEIYLDGGCHTVARLASLLISVGVDLPTIRRATMVGPLTVVLDRLIAMQGQPPAVDTTLETCANDKSAE